MSAREERRRLLAAMVGVYARAGYEEGEGRWAEVGTLLEENPYPPLGDEQEQLLAEVNAALLTLVERVAAGSEKEPPERLVIGTVGGTELVLRGEIQRQREARLPQLLPSFAYLVTLPFLGRAEALRLSQLVTAAIEELEAG